MRSYVVLGVVGLGTLLSAMMGSNVNLALPQIGREFSADIHLVGWVVSSFLLAVALLVLPAGQAGDRLGYSRIYQAGFALVALAGLGSGLAVTLPLLVAARVVQGVGGALAMSAGPALLTTTFPGSQRGRALGLLSTATYTGLTLGPPVGGMILAAWGWRWIFLLTTGVSVVILVLGGIFLPRTRCRTRCQPFRRRDPFIRGTLRLFRSPVFTGAVLSALGNYISLFIPLILMPFYLLEALRVRESTAGWILASMPLVMALVASPAGALSDRIGTRGLATGGLLVLAAGLAGLATVGSNTPAWGVGIWLGLMGLGTGTFISPNSSALMGAAPRPQQGVAAGVMAVARTVGMLGGVTAATNIYRAAGGRTGQTWGAADFRALRVALVVAVVVCMGSAVAAALRGRRNK
jgi:MFS family permease